MRVQLDDKCWAYAGVGVRVVEAAENGQTTRLLFSGDVGRKDLPIIRDRTLRSGL
jgi:hypothetical protein